MRLYVVRSFAYLKDCNFICFFIDMNFIRLYVLRISCTGRIIFWLSLELFPCDSDGHLACASSGHSLTRDRRVSIFRANRPGVPTFTRVSY